LKFKSECEELSLKLLMDRKRLHKWTCFVTIF